MIDERIQSSIDRLTNRGIITRVNGPIRQGKESIVLHALSPHGEELALKVHTSRTFRERKKKAYLFGDWRLRHAKRRILLETDEVWAEREFRNLVRLSKAKVLAPRPLAFDGLLVAMSFIGQHMIPAPRLTDVRCADYQALAVQLAHLLRRMVRGARLVHGDLSPYNILVSEERPYVIDVAQAVLPTHPKAMQLLERDVQALRSFFAVRDVGEALFDRALAELREHVALPDLKRLDRYGRPRSRV